jgi:tellurite resistance protein
MAQTRRKSAKPASETARQRSVEIVRKLAAEKAGDRVDRAGEAAAESVRGEALGRDQARAVAFARAVFRAAFLVAACDGELAPEERRRLIETMSALTNGVATPETVEAMIADSLENLQQNGFSAALAEVGRTVDNHQDREAVFLVAVGIAAVDGHVEDEELDVLDALATALHLPLERSRALAAHTLSALRAEA